MNKIMLDVETTGNIANTAIIQLSMVRFDEDGNAGDSLHINIDAEEQYKLGAQYTQSTLDWWQQTNPQLFESITTTNVHSVNEALDIIDAFVTPYDYIWCHATFDMPILDNLYHLAGRRRPYKYTNVRDIRTIVELSKINLSSYNWAKEKTHDSLDDCMFQIKYTTDAMKQLRNAGGGKEQDLERSIKGLCEMENYVVGLPHPSPDTIELGSKIFNLRVEQMKAMDLINKNNEYSYSNWIDGAED